MKKQSPTKVNPWRVILATSAGLVLGMFINSLLISNAGLFVAPPQGADLTTAEGIKKALPTMQAIHFLVPFFAHALGTFTAVFIAGSIFPFLKWKFALIFGVINLAGGIGAATMIPAPTWFVITDLVLAYLPFALLGAWVVGIRRK